MNDNLNLKSFKNKNLTASKGVFLRLILSVLSKKGNWGALLKNFNKISLKARFNLNRRVFLKDQLKTLIYSPIISESTKNLLPVFATNFNFFRKLNFSVKVKKPNFLVSLENKQEGESFKTDLVFSTLRSVHSLLNLITVYIELKNKRRGGRVFSVPVPVKSARRRRSIFIHWIKKTIIDQKKEKLLPLLVNELKGLLFKRGKSIEQLSSLEKSVRLNRVFLRKSQIKLV